MPQVSVNAGRTLPKLSCIVYTKEWSFRIIKIEITFHLKYITHYLIFWTLINHINVVHNIKRNDASAVLYILDIFDCHTFQTCLTKHYQPGLLKIEMTIVNVGRRVFLVFR